MKLKDNLITLFNTNGLTELGNGVKDYFLTPELIENNKEQLQQCDEFKGCELNVITEIKKGKPIRVQNGEDEDGIPIFQLLLDTVTLDDKKLVTVQLGKVKFAPVVNIHNIMLSPVVYEPRDVFNTEIDTAVVGPITYDQKTFTPTSRLILTWSPEQSRTNAMLEFRNSLRDADKDVEKKEFVASNEDELNQQTENVQDLLTTINQDELTKVLKDAENSYIEKLIGLVRETLTNPTTNKLPGRKYIQLKVTEDSILHDVPNNNKEEDSYILF